MPELSLAQRVEVVKLPLTGEFATEKRFKDSRGEGHLILNGPQVHRAGMFTLEPGAGYRGGHVHQSKNEYIYIAAGRGTAELFCPATKERLEMQVEAGDRLFITAGVAHRFCAQETITFVELSDRPYEAGDDLPADFGQE